MTDPRIEAAARALFEKTRAKVTEQRQVLICEYSEISEQDKNYWREDARLAVEAADAAAWRPLTDQPPSERVLIMSRHGAAVAQWDAKIDGCPTLARCGLRVLRRRLLTALTNMSSQKVHPHRPQPKSGACLPRSGPSWSLRLSGNGVIGLRLKAPLFQRRAQHFCGLMKPRD